MFEYSLVGSRNSELRSRGRHKTNPLLGGLAILIDRIAPE